MKTIINIKADKEVKKAAQSMANRFGLPLSTIINAYLKEFIRSQKITFSIEPKLRPEIERLLKQTRKDFKRGSNVSRTFSDTNEMLDYLHSR